MKAVLVVLAIIKLGLMIESDVRKTNGNSVNKPFRTLMFLLLLIIAISLIYLNL